MAHEWLMRVFEPVVRAIPCDLQRQAGACRGVPPAARAPLVHVTGRGPRRAARRGAHSYINDVLRHRRDEATVIGPPTETLSIPVITGAIGTITDDEDDWRAKV